ncbi:MAG: hypothetical protein WCQ99_09875 [Pseudomonadota bacterium]
MSQRADVWCPYNGESDADRPGILIEIAKYAFESQGHKGPVSSGKILLEVKVGERTASLRMAAAGAKKSVGIACRQERLIADDNQKNLASLKNALSAGYGLYCRRV